MFSELARKNSSFNKKFMLDHLPGESKKSIQV